MPVRRRRVATAAAAACLAGLASLIALVAHCSSSSSSSCRAAESWQASSVFGFGSAVEGYDGEQSGRQSLRNVDGRSADEAFAASIRRLQSVRQADLRAACASVSVKPDMLGTIFNVPDLGITYCCIAKCASTTFKTFLEVATNKTCPKRDAHTCARKQFPMIGAFDRFLPNSVIIVRNPWDRLVSAYTDKFVKERIRFSKFCYDYHNMTFRDGPAVSFAQFVECLLNEVAEGRSLNPHVAPIHWHCMPCQANYTYIAKLETLSADFNFLKLVVFPKTFTQQTYDQAIGSVGRRSHEKKNITALTYEKSYSSLSKTALNRIVSLYAPDALMFGYDQHPLLRLSIHQSEGDT